MRAEIVPLTDIPEAWDAAWDALVARASEPNAFAERWFMRPSIAYLAPPPGALMAGVWDGAEIIGMMPLCNARRYGRLPLQHLQNWQHYHNFLGLPLVADGHERGFWRTLLDALDGDARARSFVHFSGLAPGPVLDALHAARRADVVHETSRALWPALGEGEALAHIRPKKRKELRRLRARLDDTGTVAFEHDRGPSRIAEFLALESAGWKGRANSALAAMPETHAFAEAALQGAADTGRLELLTMTLDGKPIAMLANFVTPPGSFSFKIAYDEAYARYSPGVLLQLENMAVARPGVEWMDSCAVEDHAMINSLWPARRTIVRVTVPLSGVRRRAVFSAARAIERGAAMARRRR